MDLDALLFQYGIEPQAAKVLYQKTMQLYASEGRFYHTLKHIQQVFETVNFLLEAGNFPITNRDHLSLSLAVWFHDVVYDPQRNDNEAQSALWMGRELGALGIPNPILHRVSDLIMVTRDHVAPADDLPAQILLDADLSILGASPEIYVEYAKAIRQEYSFVPEDAYRSGRQSVLEKFLARPQIYLTSAAYIQFESKARKNLKGEIQGLCEFP